MQTQQSYGFLLELREEQFLIVSAEQPAPLHLIENESGPVLTETISRTAGSTRHTTRMPHKSRIGCYDGHPSNKNSNDLFRKIRAGWPDWMVHCELHLVAISINSLFSAVAEEAVRGILYGALVLRVGENMNVFREILYLEIADTLDILSTGAPSHSATSHRRARFDFFFYDGVIHDKIACRDFAERRLESARSRTISCTARDGASGRD